MRASVSILAGIAVFLAAIGGWWFYWPVWRVEAQVRDRIAPTDFARFSSVKFNRLTGTGCGYVDAGSSRAAPPGKTHFVLLPDGSLKFDPNDRIAGSTTQQLEALRKHADYLALVYARCT